MVTKNIWKLNDKGKLSGERADELVNLLNAGKIIIAPTDTTYGLLGISTSETVSERITRLKKRSPGKPYITLLHDLHQLPSGAKLNSPYFYRLVKYFWPGALTMVIPTRDSDTGSAFRIPDSPFLDQILPELSAPLIAPSANAAGEPAVTNVSHAVKIFGTEIDVYIDGGTLQNDKFSTIVTLEKIPPVILREGMIETGKIIHSVNSKHILFVCTGNTCRSPMAEGLARNLFPSPDYVFSSAGLATIDGHSISSYSSELLKREGINPDNLKTTVIKDVDVLSQDLIIALDWTHIHSLEIAYPEIMDRVRLITSFNNGSSEGIPDPVGGTMEDYEKSYRVIKECLNAMKGKI